MGSCRRRGRMLLAGSAVWKSSASVQHSSSSTPGPPCSISTGSPSGRLPRAANIAPASATDSLMPPASGLQQPSPRAKAPVSQAWTQFADIKRIRHGAGLGLTTRRASRHSGSTGSSSADMPDRSVRHARCGLLRRACRRSASGFRAGRLGQGRRFGSSLGRGTAAPAVRLPGSAGSPSGMLTVAGVRPGTRKPGTRTGAAARWRTPGGRGLGPPGGRGNQVSAS